jgi:hypothetical protein
MTSLMILEVAEGFSPSFMILIPVAQSVEFTSVGGSGDGSFLEGSR